MTAPVTRSLGALALTLARRWWPQLAALAAACGVVATVVSGALGVGDVIQGGLRGLALERLGRIEAAVLGDGFFRSELATELATELAQSGRDDPRPLQFTPAVVMPVTAASAARVSAVSRATLLACDDPAALGYEPATPPLTEGGVLVNAQLAAAIGVAEGDTLLLRLPHRSRVPADSPLGRRTDDARSRRMRVSAVLPDAGIGRFAVRPAQATPPLVVMSLEDAQAILREGDVANAIFAVAASAPDGVHADAATAIRRLLRPRLVDYGLALDPLEDGGLRLSSRRLMIPAEVDRAAQEVLGPLGGWPSLAFLANEMLPDEPVEAPAAPRIPYSTVLGIEGPSLPGGGLIDAGGAMLPTPSDDEMIVGRWMADDLAAQGRPLAIGDILAVRFFLPETIHGQVEERTESFRVSGIAELRGTAVDRSLVPEVEGVTDEESIADWDPPFPFDSSRVRTVPPHDEDDRYWKQYRATPKAFVSLAAARRIAAGRFGATTAWHLARPDTPRDELAARLAAAIRPEAAGIAVVPLRAEAVAAARGSTPFGGLFLALSAFVVVAGLLLAWLLFGLLVAAQRRAIGLLAAVGWPPARLARLLLAIGGLAAVAGVLAGAVLGPIWSRLLIALLERAWTGDVAAGSSAVFRGGLPGPLAPLPGCVATLAMALAALAIAARRTGRTTPLTLLGGGGQSADDGFRRPGRWSTAIAVVGLLAAALAALAARNATGSTAVGLFFAAGCSALGGLLALARGRLFAGNARSAVRSLPQFAARTVAARPGRGFSIAAIVAAGQFLVVAVSAFALRPPADAADRRSPTGGWTWIAALGEPSSVDPADRDAVATLGLTAAQERTLGRCEIARLRVSDGDDASCTNLYAAARPTVLGVGPGFIARGGFSFTAHAPLAAAAGGNPWRLLDGAVDRDRGPMPASTPVPAILDQATAQWGLKLGGVGSRFTLPDEAGEPVEFEIVGLLEPGILQGRVIVAERNFQRLFPSRSGYALALVDAAAVDVAARPQVPAALQAAWADAGVSLESAVDRLRALQAVQNTFLAGFQALGTLGLLLGTAGVAAVQLQGVVERLGSLVILQAIGFSLARVRAWLVLETLVTVGAGLAIGTLAGTIAVWPALAGGVARLPLLWITATGGVTLTAAAAAGWLATAAVKTGFARPAARTVLSRPCTSP